MVIIIVSPVSGNGCPFLLDVSNGLSSPTDLSSLHP